jgi:alkylated DNA repair dioxygenase AlkB
MAQMSFFDSLEPVDLLPPGDSRALYFPAYIDDIESDSIFHELNGAEIWHQPDILMFGRTSKLPREVAWVAEPGQQYKYSGVSSNPQPWTPLLKELCQRVTETAGTTFNSVLLNRYRDGNDTVAWHVDDEAELGYMPMIASLSLGADRRFQFRNKKTRETIEKRLAHGSLLIMSGHCQKEWLHQIPRERRILSPRINLTFRNLHT